MTQKARRAYRIQAVLLLAVAVSFLTPYIGLAMADASLAKALFSIPLAVLLISWIAAVAAVLWVFAEDADREDRSSCLVGVVLRHAVATILVFGVIFLGLLAGRGASSLWIPAAAAAALFVLGLAMHRRSAAS